VTASYSCSVKRDVERSKADGVGRASRMSGTLDCKWLQESLSRASVISNSEEIAVRQPGLARLSIAAYNEGDSRSLCPIDPDPPLLSLIHRRHLLWRA